MESQTLQAEVREERGKGPARRLRQRGLIPAVFYGPNVEPIPIAVSPKDVHRLLTTDHGRNTVVRIELGGKGELALCKDLAVDPVTRDLVHADFYRVEEGREVDVEVPFRTRGRAAGVKEGGTLHVTLRSLPVRTIPGLIPAAIEVDVTKLVIGDVVRVQDLQLPEGVSVLRAPHRTLVTVMAEDKRAAEAEAADAAEAAAAGGAVGAESTST
jgi:large subunit ribosomal protein L25